MFLWPSIISGGVSETKDDFSLFKVTIGTFKAEKRSTGPGSVVKVRGFDFVPVVGVGDLDGVSAAVVAWVGLVAHLT